MGKRTRDKHWLLTVLKRYMDQKDVVAAAVAGGREPSSDEKFILQKRAADVAEAAVVYLGDDAKRHEELVGAPTGTGG